jgi:hypothetical protein
VAAADPRLRLAISQLECPILIDRGRSAFLAAELHKWTSTVLRRGRSDNAGADRSVLHKKPIKSSSVVPSSIADTKIVVRDRDFGDCDSLTVKVLPSS